MFGCGITLRVEAILGVEETRSHLWNQQMAYGTIVSSNPHSYISGDFTISPRWLWRFLVNYSRSPILWQTVFSLLKELVNDADSAREVGDWLAMTIAADSFYEFSLMLSGAKYYQMFFVGIRLGLAATAHIRVPAQLNHSFMKTKQYQFFTAGQTVLDWQYN